jgi:hypothetical protein
LSTDIVDTGVLLREVTVDTVVWFTCTTEDMGGLMSGAIVDIDELTRGATCGTSRLLGVTDVVEGLLLRVTTVGDNMLVRDPPDAIGELNIGETAETAGLTRGAIDVGAISISVV